MSKNIKLETTITELARLYQKKNFVELIKTAETILRKDNSSAIIWNFLALGYRYIGQTQKAVNLYEKLLEKNSNNFILNVNAGNLFLALGRIQESIVCFKQALSAEPNKIEVLWGLGISYIELGDFDSAQIHFEKILKIDNSHSAARFRLGRVLKKKRCFKEAAEHFDKTDFELSKAHQLECYYLQGDKKIFYEKYEELIIKPPLNPLTAAIVCHASIRYNKKLENPFCNKPMDYIRKVRLSEKEGLSDDLIDSLIEIRNSTDIKKQPLLEKGEQSSGNLFLIDRPEVKNLKQILEKQIEEYRTHFFHSSEGFLKKWPQNSSLFGWLVFINKGGQLKAHIHNQGWLSGSIYFKIPKKKSPGEGNISFDLSGSDYPDEGKTFPKTEHNIKKGDLVLFPSSLYHNTLPFSSDEERVSLAFDVMPK